MENSASPTEFVMRRLWQRMAEIYGHRWTSAYGDDAGKGAGETWAKGLRGLSASQIAKGLDRAMVSADPWPPTLPQFRALCLDIPSLAKVRIDLRRTDSERMPFTVLVGRELDQWTYTRADQDRADRMLRDAYETAREHVMAGGPLPAPLSQIERRSEPIKPAPPEVVAKHMAAVAELLGDPVAADPNPA